MSRKYFSKRLILLILIIGLCLGATSCDPLLSGTPQIKLPQAGTPRPSDVGSVTTVKFSPSGQMLASGHGGKLSDNVIRLWNLQQPNTAPLVLRGHTGPVHQVVFSPNGNFLASSSDDQTVRLWNLNDPNASPVVLSGFTSNPISICFSPDGQLLALGNSSNFQLWNVAQLNISRPTIITQAGIILSLVFSPTGNIIATGDSTGIVRLYDLDDFSATPIALKGHNLGVLSVAFSPDGSLLASASDDETVRVWHLLNSNNSSTLLQIPKRRIKSVDRSNAAQSVTFSPDGQLLAVGSSNEEAILWNIENLNTNPMVLIGHTGTVTSVDFSPDGQTLASGSTDGTVRLWSMRQPVITPTILPAPDSYSYKKP